MCIRDRVKEMLTKDLRLKWGVKAADFDKQGRIFELYAIKSTERNGRAPLEGDVITDAGLLPLWCVRFLLCPR